MFSSSVPVSYTHLQLVADELAAGISLGFVDDHGKGVHQILVEQHVQLYQLGFLIADKLVIQGAVSAGL